jgi:membrane protein YdbS with pleckstrin-like domain
MDKTIGATCVLASILLGAIVWFVLQVIIGVLAWVSVIAGGVVALVGVLMALGAIGARAGKRHRHHDSMLAH